MEPWVHFGPALRLLRTKAGLTQRQVQERTGIRSRTLSSYETGQRLPPMTSFMTLLDGLGYGLLDFAAALRFAAGDPQPFRSEHWQITVHPRAPQAEAQAPLPPVDVRSALVQQERLARQLLDLLERAGATAGTSAGSSAGSQDS